MLPFPERSNYPAFPVVVRNIHSPRSTWGYPLMSQQARYSPEPGPRGHTASSYLQQKTRDRRESGVQCDSSNDRPRRYMRPSCLTAKRYQLHEHLGALLAFQDVEMIPSVPSHAESRCVRCPAPICKCCDTSMQRTLLRREHVLCNSILTPQRLMGPLTQSLKISLRNQTFHVAMTHVELAVLRQSDGPKKGLDCA